MMTRLDLEPVHVCERRGGQFPLAHIARSTNEGRRYLPDSSILLKSVSRHFETRGRGLLLLLFEQSPLTRNEALALSKTNERGRTGEGHESSPGANNMVVDSATFCV